MLLLDLLLGADHPLSIHPHGKQATVQSLAQRWQPCTLPFIVSKKATAYAWLVPGELAVAPFGAFAYRFTEDSGVSPRAYCVVASV